MADKPTDLPRWNPPQEETVYPDIAKQDAGFGQGERAGEPPPFQWFNALFARIYRWLAFLKSYAETHVHDGGGTDISAPKVDLKNHIAWGDYGYMEVDIDGPNLHLIKHVHPDPNQVGGEAMISTGSVELSGSVYAPDGVVLANMARVNFIASPPAKDVIQIIPVVGWGQNAHGLFVVEDDNANAHRIVYRHDEGNPSTATFETNILKATSVLKFPGGSLSQIPFGGNIQLEVDDANGQIHLENRIQSGSGAEFDGAVYGHTIAGTVGVFYGTGGAELGKLAYGFNKYGLSFTYQNDGIFKSNVTAQEKCSFFITPMDGGVGDPDYVIIPVVYIDNGYYHVAFRQLDGDPAIHGDFHVAFYKFP